MTFDFDEIIPRRGSHSMKWEAAADPEVLPMWVADMDFKTVPAVTRALEKRAAHGVFGYTKVPPEYFTAISGWFERRHRVAFNPEHILYTTGVVPAVSAIIQALCQPGDGIIVQTPAYNCFFSSIRNSLCHLVANPLRYENGEYTIDFDDLEAKAANPKNTLMLLCNPHNPVGRVWQPEELRRIGEICLTHGVILVSDEIHCDLVQPGFQHTAFASLDEQFMQTCITCISASKSFNLAGLQAANMVVADASLRQRIDKQLNINEICSISPFAVDGVITAYNEGADWLDALRGYIAGNAACVAEFLQSYLPQFRHTPLEATYLMWIDCSALPLPSADIADALIKQHKVWITHGTLYGDDGEGFLRLNIATPRATLLEGLTRFRAAFSTGGALADYQI